MIHKYKFKDFHMILEGRVINPLHIISINDLADGCSEIVVDASLVMNLKRYKVKEPTKDLMEHKALAVNNLGRKYGKLFEKSFLTEEVEKVEKINSDQTDEEKGVLALYDAVAELREKEQKLPYICPQCGIDYNGSKIHQLTHHTLPPMSADEAITLLITKWQDGFTYIPLYEFLGISREDCQKWFEERGLFDVKNEETKKNLSKMIFSQRRELGEELDLWIEKNNIKNNGLGYLSALQALKWTIKHDKKYLHEEG